MDSCGQRILHSTTSNYYGMAITRNNVIDKRIVGGRVSSDGAWPWQVALMLDDVQVCAGSIIRPNWVLTACHCFTGVWMTRKIQGTLIIYDENGRKWVSNRNTSANERPEKNLGISQTPNKELPSSIEESSLVFLKAKVMSLYPWILNFRLLTRMITLSEIYLCLNRLSVNKGSNSLES